MKPAWVPLAEITLTSTDSEITFGSIPNTYRDLIVVYTAKSTSTVVNGRLRFNGDTAGNYFGVFMAGISDNTTTSQTRSSETSIFLDNAYAANPSVTIINIFDYAQTDKQKTILNRSNSYTEQVSAHASRWASTAAINSVTIYPTAGSWEIGSQFALYGSNKL